MLAFPRKFREESNKENILMMNWNKIALLVVLTIGISSCGNSKQNEEKNTLATATPIQTKETTKGYKKAYFASGCFWCIEAVYESVKGVKDAVSGYSGGTGDNPTYKNYGSKGHAEAVEVIYDPKVVSFDELLTVYFASQNVTQQNGQGPDRGTSYRSIIFFQNKGEKAAIEAKIKEVQKKYDKPVAAEVMPFQKFWKAEDYHQQYEENHPENPYVQNVSIPRLNKFKRKVADSLLKPEYR